MSIKGKNTIPNKGTDFESTIKEIRNLYHQAVQSRQFRSEAEKIQMDSKWTDLFQRLSRHGNSDVLSGFKLRLMMDEENEREEISQE